MRYPVNAVDSLVWVIGPNEEWAAAISAAAHSIFPNFSKRLGVDPGGFGSRPAAPLSGDGLARWRQFRLITTARLPSSRTPSSVGISGWVSPTASPLMLVGSLPPLTSSSITRLARRSERSEERRVGKEWVRTCRSRWW